MELEPKERDKDFEKNVLASNLWGKYFLAVGQFLLIFFVVMLAMQLNIFYFHRGLPWGTPETATAVLAVLITIVAFVSMLRKLPMGVFMLAMPIVPLCMLIIVLTSFPVLHFLEKEFAAHGFLSPSAFLSDNHA